MFKCYWQEFTTKLTTLKIAIIKARGSIIQYWFSVRMWPERIGTPFRSFCGSF